MLTFITIERNLILKKKACLEVGVRMSIANLTVLGSVAMPTKASQISLSSYYKVVEGEHGVVFPS